MAQVVKNEAGNSRIMDAQGNTIFPCGYRGGAKDRTSAPVEFEEHSVSLSSQVKKQPWGSLFIGRPSRRPFDLQTCSRLVMQVHCSTTCVNMHRARLNCPRPRPSPASSLVPPHPTPPHHCTTARQLGHRAAAPCPATI